MYSALRRRERRQDIIEELRNHYQVTEVIDYSPFEDDGCCLEGTGSLVFDHLNKIAYVSLSNRSNPKVIQRFADDFSYEPVTFTSIDSNGQPIYHTNVMMCIGTAFAMVGLEMIPNKLERQQVRARLEKTEKEIVELSADQIANFAGNAIELQNKSGEKLLVLSSRAARALTEEQRKTLTGYARLLPLELPTIELGGGSARCMMATIHLPPRCSSAQATLCLSGATSSLRSASRAGGFDEACGFAALLAGIRIFDELKKRRFGHDAEKLLEASALCENFLQAPPEQSVELETRRTGRADASNISLLSDVKPVAGEWNGCVSVRVGKIIDATEDRLAVRRSRRYPDHTVVF